jgi:hypothetical protein
MVHIPENSQNTLVIYSSYNFPVQTKSDDSFVTILTNSGLHCATPHTPSYKYIQLPSPSTHTQHPQPRQTPHPLSYSALPATHIVSIHPPGKHLHSTTSNITTPHDTDSAQDSTHSYIAILTTIPYICWYTCWFVCLLIHVA